MADKKAPEKDELTVVGPGADEDGSSVADQTPVNEGAGTDYNYADPDADDEEGLEAGDRARDERTGHAQNEPGDDADGNLTREQKRRRRKKERYERDQREMAFLRHRNEQLERDHSARLAAMESRQTQSDVLTIDGRIATSQAQVREAETLFAQAVKSGDETAIAEALRIRDELRDGLQQYRAAKQQTVHAARERQTTAQQPPDRRTDPAVAQRAREWAREHAWFDPQGGDDDSAIAYTVEQRVFREGRLDPATDEYWDEVDRRLARRLPEHYNTGGRVDEDEDEDDRDDARDRRPAQRRVNGNGKDRAPPARRASGPTIKVGGRERTLRKGEVYIDEDRKQAMIEKGVWDDPVLRERQLQYYQRFDREAGRRPR